VKQIVWLLFVLLVVAMAGIGSAIKLSALGPDVIKYQKEWVTALLQVGLIAVLGAVTTAVLELFKLGLQRSKDRSKLQLDVLSDLRQHYKKVKLIRRNYQASQTLSADDVKALNEVQLELEVLRDDSDLFGRTSMQVFNALSKMERYLNHLANDSASTERATFQNSAPPANSFKVFSHAYKSAKTAMRLEIAPPSILARIRHAIQGP